MKKKVLVLGCSGLIGHQIYLYLKSTNKYILYGFANKRRIDSDTVLVNAKNQTTLRNEIFKINPDIIINAIGVLINHSNKNPEDAIFLNSYLPHWLSSLSNNNDIKIIHFSTDCVFSGDKNVPYLEDDYKDAKNIYGKTKGLGELINDKDLTIRTSVVGPEIDGNGEELFNWFMNQKDGDIIYGYKNAIWSGITTFQLAKSTDYAINKGTTGLIHLTNNSKISKLDLLLLFKKFTNKDITIKESTHFKSDKSFIDSKKTFGYSFPKYPEMIEEMISKIKFNKKLYPHYKNL